MLIFIGKGKEMKKKVVFVLLCLVSAILSMFINPNYANAFSAAVDASYPPFAIYNEKGELEGFEVDVINAISKKIGEKADIINLEYPGALVGITSGKIDLIVTVDESDVKRDKVTLSQPIMECGLTAIINKNNTTLKNEDDVKNGKNVKIGVVQGTLAAEEGAKRYGEDKLAFFDSAEVMYESLIQNKIDVVVNDSVVNAYYMKKSTRSNQLKNLSEEFSSSSGVSAITKKNPKLAKKILQAIVDLEKDGTLAKIRKKWNFHL